MTYSFRNTIFYLEVNLGNSQFCPLTPYTRGLSYIESSVCWLIVCVNLTGHEVPRLNIISGYVCVMAFLDEISI